MPTKKVNPIEEHFEKGILGIAVIVLIYILFAFTMGSRSGLMIAGNPAVPGQAFRTIREKAEQLEQTARSAESSWPKFQTSSSTDNTSSVVLQGLNKNFVQVLPAIVPPNKEFSPDVIRGTYDIPKVLSPSKLVYKNGRSAFDVSQDEPLRVFLNVPESETLVDCSWITLAGEIDLEKQRKEMEKLPEYAEHEPIYLRVDLQRAEIGKDGKAGEWVNVPVLDAENLLLNPDEPNSLTVKTIEEIKTIMQSVGTKTGEVESFALNSEFPPILAGEEWEPPLLPGEEKPKPEVAKEPKKEKESERIRAIPAKHERAVPGGGGRRGGGGRGGIMGGPGAGGGAGAVGGRTRNAGRSNRQPAGGNMMGPPGMMGAPGVAGPPVMMGPPGMAPGGMQGQGMGTAMPSARTQVKLTDEERKNKKTLKFWAYDLTATPGVSYKYRARVVMLNPLAGYRLILKEPDLALEVGLPSGWVEVKSPITIDNKSYYFVDGTGDTPDTISVTVYKWYLGWIYTQKFAVKKGEKIGGKKSLITYTPQAPNSFISARKEIDFSTGATLEDFSVNQTVTIKRPDGESVTETGVTQMTVRTSDGQTLKQDTANNSNNSDLKKCKEALRKIRMNMPNYTIVMEGKPGKETAP